MSPEELNGAGTMISTFMFGFAFAFTPVFAAFGFHQLGKDEPHPIMHRILVYGMVVPAAGLLALVATA
jgi:hypothetical protein